MVITRLDGIVAGVSYGDSCLPVAVRNSVAWDTSLVYKFRAANQTTCDVHPWITPPIRFLVIISSCLTTLRCTIFVIKSNVVPSEQNA